MTSITGGSVVSSAGGSVEPQIFPWRNPNQKKRGVLPGYEDINLQVYYDFDFTRG